MRLKLFLVAAMIMGAGSPAMALPTKDVKRCNAMAASFKAKKAEIEEAKAALDKKAELAEEAGERWEAAEEMKLISARNAKMAQDAKAEWETLKSEVYKDQVALKSKVQMLNKDVAAFNASCATE